MMLHHCLRRLDSFIEALVWYIDEPTSSHLDVERNGAILGERDELEGMVKMSLM